MRRGVSVNVQEGDGGRAPEQVSRLLWHFDDQDNNRLSLYALAPLKAKTLTPSRDILF